MHVVSYIIRSSVFRNYVTESELDSPLEGLQFFVYDLHVCE